MQLLDTRLVPDRPATARADPAAPAEEVAVLPLADPTGTATAAGPGPLPPPLGPPPPLPPRGPELAVTAAGGTATDGAADEGALLLELMV